MVPHVVGTPTAPATAPDRPGPTSWSQWGENQKHTGAFDVTGQPFARELADIIYDPFVAQEQASTRDPTTPSDPGELLAHYQAPLLDGADVYMGFKSGKYSSDTFATQVWSEKKLSWQGEQLVVAWEFVSDWKPPGSPKEIWEPVFHPVLANGGLYVPMSNGAIEKVDMVTGKGLGRIWIFPNDDPNRFVVSPLTADSSGNIYYNVLALATSSLYSSDAVDSWLVKITPDDQVSTVSYAKLTEGAPRSSDSCLGSFSDEPLPWPPSTDAVPRSRQCGLQRVGLNVAPAIGGDGTIYSVTTAHFNEWYSYIVAANPDLTPKWSTSLRDRFQDGCGVPLEQGGTLPPDGAPGGCRAGANHGVDPRTNRPGAGMVDDSSSSTPVVAPDGSVYYGALTVSNYVQGHLMHFGADGGYLGAFPFGWDSTPAIYEHDGTYSVVVKDNHYGVSSYCHDETFCPSDRAATNAADPTAYFVTQLSPGLDVEWRFQNVNTDSCSRAGTTIPCSTPADCPNGLMCLNGMCTSCVSDHPHSFEWCVNAPVVDAEGTVYANSEDGWLYAISQGGMLKERRFQRLALGAAYTPTSLGADGKIYSQNAGHLLVLGE